MTNTCPDCPPEGEHDVRVELAGGHVGFDGGIDIIGGQTTLGGDRGRVGWQTGYTLTAIATVAGILIFLTTRQHDQQQNQ